MSENNEEKIYPVAELNTVKRIAEITANPFGALEVPAAYTSLVLESEDDRLKFFDAVNGDCVSIRDYINTEIEITDVTLFPAQSVNPETGEVDHYPGELLHLADGATVRAGSKGIYASLRSYCSIVGLPPWKPAVRFKVVQLSIGEGRSTIKLMRVAREMKAKQK